MVKKGERELEERDLKTKKNQKANYKPRSLEDTCTKKKKKWNHINYICCK